MTWIRGKIQTLGRIVTGKTPPTADQDNYGGDFPFITPSDMKGYRSTTPERYVTEKGKTTVKGSLLPPYSVCVSCIGSDMGKVIMTTEAAVTNQQINSIIPGSDFDARFVYYLMCTLTTKIKSLGKNATAVPILNKSKFSDIDISYPLLETQRRIADILSAYDDLIENNQKQIKLLEEAAQRLYREWFVELRFPGHEITPVVNGVPEGWEVKKVADLSATLRRGISPVYNDKAATRVINQKCIRQTIVDYSESRMQEKVYPEELALRDSDTVICSTGAGTLGRVGQIHGECSDTTLDSHVTLVRANASTGKQFLFWSLKAQQAFFMGAGKGSTNQLELSRETIGSLDVLVPTKEIMCTFEQHAQAIHDKQTACTQQNILLKDARDRLLPKLMSGEVEV